MKTLLSLFDFSGQWSKPFAENGWDVIQWDIKLDEFMDINFFESCEQVLDMFGDIDGIIAAPPCTDFTVSGNQYWSKKDADGTTAKAMEMVFQVQRLADLFRPTDPEFEGTFFWAAENPVGRMGRLCGMENPFYFNPFEFAGWNNPTLAQLAQLDAIRLKDGQGVTNDECQLVIDVNAYTKKTGLWGEFNRNMIKKPIQPVKCSPQGSPTQRVGGKSAKTKEFRSNTPQGFAWAFYQANHDYQCHMQDGQFIEQ